MAHDFIDQPRPARTGFVIAVLAFLCGLAVMAWILMRWEPARRLVGATPAVMGAASTAAPARPQQALAVPGPAAAPAPSPGQAQAIDLRVAELEARMARIDLRAAAAAGNAGRAEGLLIAFAARRALDRGVALGYVEGQLRERFGEAQPRAVAAIIAASQAPVTLDGLRQGLDAVAPSLINPGANESWGQAIRRSLADLIVVRRADTPSPAPDERIARARLRLESGEVDGALAEVARLPGSAVATAWMSAARRYIEAHRALDLIEAAAITVPPPPNF